MLNMKRMSWAASALTWVALSAAAATSTAVQQQNWSIAGLGQPADIVIVASWVFNNARLLLMSQLGSPYDPVAAPLLGEHTNEVLRKTLGYDEGRIAALAEAGAFGTTGTNT